MLLHAKQLGEYKSLNPGSESMRIKRGGTVCKDSKKKKAKAALSAPINPVSPLYLRAG